MFLPSRCSGFDETESVEVTSLQMGVLWSHCAAPTKWPEVGVECVVWRGQGVCTGVLMAETQRAPGCSVALQGAQPGKGCSAPRRHLSLETSARSSAGLNGCLCAAVNFHDAQTQAAWVRAC